jgi:hypothetical protein
MDPLNKTRNQGPMTTSEKENDVRDDEKLTQRDVV